MSTTNRPSLKDLSLVNTLKSVSDALAYGCLIVSNDFITWKIYFHQGKITYATNSVAAFERLERSLRFLNRDIAPLIPVARAQAKLNSSANLLNTSNIERSEYQVIHQLFQYDYVSASEAALLAKKITKESIESYFLVPEVEVTQKEFVDNIDEYPTFCRLECQSFLQECYEDLQSWKALVPQIQSPYQRLFWAVQSPSQKNNFPEHLQKLSKLLKGVNFRQLAALLKQDELQLAQKLHPLLVNKLVILGEPQSPFDKLPKLTNEANSSTQDLTEEDVPALEKGRTSDSSSKEARKIWKVVCVDDSPTVLNEINRILENPSIVVTKVDDPLKALMKIIQIKPDLILLDVGMPNIDGYNLCSLLRKNSLFKSTPIIMVTGHKGLIDRAKAKFVGATGYLTKPFTKEELLDVVFKNLPDLT